MSMVAYTAHQASVLHTFLYAVLMPERPCLPSRRSLVDSVAAAAAAAGKAAPARSAPDLFAARLVPKSMRLEKQRQVG